MSILHVNRISRRLKDLFAAHIPSDDLSAVDQQRDIKVLTRCLAAFAVYSRCGCSELEAANSVVDGIEDNGLDAIYFNQASKTLYVVQSKWIQDGVGEPSSADIGKFCQGVNDLINTEWDRFNPRVLTKKTEIENALDAFDVKVELILIYTGSSSLAVHGMNRINDLLGALNDASELVDFVPMNQAEIYRCLSSGTSGAPVHLEFGLAHWGKIDEPLESYYGTITGEEIAGWWKSTGDRLFERNLRGVLGKTDVNVEVTGTIENRPSDFWFFNNGITVVATKVTKTLAGGSNRELGTFKAEGASVVNGAQTVSTLGKFAGPSESLAKVRVLLRVISLEKAPAAEDYGLLITRTNNTQNRIEGRDFVTQDPEQARIRQELALDGVTYTVIRSETHAAIQGPLIDLQDATVALACAKSDAALAVLAKRNIGQFWSDTKKAPYKTIFNPSTSSLKLQRAVSVLRDVDAALLSEIKKLTKRSGKPYGVLVHGNRLIASAVFDQIDSTLLTDAAKSLPKSEELKAIAERTAKSMIRVVEKRYPDSFMATLFKNTDKCRHIFTLTSLDLAGK